MTSRFLEGHVAPSSSLIDRRGRTVRNFQARSVREVRTAFSSRPEECVLSSPGGTLTRRLHPASGRMPLQKCPPSSPGISERVVLRVDGICAYLQPPEMDVTVAPNLMGHPRSPRATKGGGSEAACLQRCRQTLHDSAAVLGGVLFLARAWKTRRSVSAGDV